MADLPSPTFGLVIPAYNRAHVIADALASAQQGFAQIVVVDDGSTDGTADVVSTFDGVELIRQENQGATVARNRGVAALRTDWVTFLDSDDQLLPGFLDRYRAAAGGDVVVVTSGVERVRRGRPEPTVLLPQPMGPAYADVTGLFRHGGTYAVRRDVFLRVGGFDADQPASQHTELALRLLNHLDDPAAQVAVLHEPLLRYHVGEGDGIRADRVKVGLGAARLVDRHHQFLAKDPVALADHAAVAGTGRLRAGDVAAARRYFRLAIRHRPAYWKAWARLGRTYLPGGIRARSSRSSS